MGHSEVNEEVLSEATGGQGEIGVESKLVPVAESIRYRKRAQAAEKENEDLRKQLADIDQESSVMKDKLKDVELENELSRRLSALGAIDLEAAVLMAKVKAEGKDKADLESVVDQLRKEKQYLFGVSEAAVEISMKTAAAKDRVQSGRSAVERAAKRAAVSGSRVDLQEYLKLRRKYY